MKRVIFLICCTIIVGGCAKKTVVVVDNKPVGMTEFERSMSDAAKIASDSLQTLSRINNAAKRQVLTSNQVKYEVWQESVTVNGLSRKTSVDWSGPAGVFLKEMCKNIDGWAFKTKNRAPSPDIFVSMHKENVTFLDVIREVGAQTGSEADVIVDEKNHTITLVYLDVSSGTGAL